MISEFFREYMRRYVDNSAAVLARDVGRALPINAADGMVELVITNIGTQVVHVISTPGRFGGCLRWFRCPGCSRRVGKLFLPTSEQAFLCRRCHRLVYRKKYCNAKPKIEPENQANSRPELLDSRERVPVPLKNTEKSPPVYKALESM